MSVGGRRHRLVAVWVLLAALVGAIVAIEHTDLVRPRAGRANAPDQRLLLPVPVDQLGAIEVADAGTLHRFARDAAGRWFYHGVHTGSEPPHAHTVDPDVAQRIEQALLAFGRARIERHVTGGRDRTAYGVTTPRIVILAYRPDAAQPLVQFAVGDVAPDTVSRYVDVVGGAGVVTIPTYQIDNLLALIEAVRETPTQGAAAGAPGQPPAPAGPPAAR